MKVVWQNGKTLPKAVHSNRLFSCIAQHLKHASIEVCTWESNQESISLCMTLCKHGIPHYANY